MFVPAVEFSRQLLTMATKTDYRYLGMPYNDLLRKRSEALVDQYKRNHLGWQTALLAGKKFSAGRVCSQGEGTGLDRSKQVEIEGGFNLCYWIQVEGESGQWVVRFPLKGITSEETTMRRMRSEIATLQFLARYTKVPVPRVIGYHEGDDSLPPFTILGNIDGIRMNVWLKVDVNPIILDNVFKDLAEIQLELLSHPSHTIGMLDIPSSGLANSSSYITNPSVGPYSLDSIDHERDGVFTATSGPFTYARDYYNHKLSVWKQRLDGQQNSITGPEDGKRKYLNHGILTNLIHHINPAPDKEGPYYLFHPDLDSSNVILHKRTFRVIGIIDWEGACFLPLESSCTPPKAMFPEHIDLLSPNSIQYIEFQKRAARYIDILSREERKEEVTTRPVIGGRMASYLANGWMFLIWALDDVRYVDDMVWQHLAPSLYHTLKSDLDRAIASVPTENRRKRAEAIDDVFAAFADRLLSELRLDQREWESWLGRKLKELEEYDKMLQDSI
jgi:aminoglycoside phosphotransferase (APT) family kinase protein